MTAAAAGYQPRARHARAILRDQQPTTSDEQPGTSDEQPALALERSEGTSHLTEATLSALWAGQRFPASAIVTVAGEPLSVLHPGWPGRGAGPDFRDALIVTPGGDTLRGDVELHVRASDFVNHGHGRDRRYDRVVLHVVFDAGAAAETELASGRRVPVVALGSWAAKRAHELAGWLRSPGLWREPCHDAVARFGADEVARRIDALGEARSAEREQALADDIECLGAGEALYRGLLAGAGYGGERERFAAIAEALPARELVERIASVPAPTSPVGQASTAPDGRVAVAEAALLEAAGLLAGSVRPTGGSASWPAGLASSRPANHPARRLAGLARLAVRHLPLLAGDERPGALDGKPSALIAAWTVAADGDWRRQTAPGRPAKRALGALIGRGRAIELLTNAVLPWAAARGDDRARAMLARLPAPSRYGSLAFLEANLEHAGRRLPLTARRQQGLLALYRTECTRGGCGRCPLS